MAKENKKSLIIWALVALVIGVILGLVLTNLTTTGQAKASLQEAQYITADNSLFGELRLAQWFDIGGFQEKHYYFYQYEYAESTVPANLQKSTQFVLSTTGIASGSYNELKLKLNDSGKYSAHGFSYSYIPFTKNNLSVSTLLYGHFVFENGREIYKQKEFVSNPNTEAFSEATTFNFECPGQYKLRLSNINNNPRVHLYLSILDQDGGVNSFDWTHARSPDSQHTFIGNFPTKAITMLSSGLNYDVYLTAYIKTDDGLLTNANTGKTINCQTIAETALSESKRNNIEKDKLKEIQEKFSK